MNKILIALATAVAALTLLAGPSGAQQYPPSSMGTTASSVPSDEPLIERQESSSSPLARTGLDAAVIGTFALVLGGGGALLVIASRRPTRKV